MSANERIARYLRRWEAATRWIGITGVILMLTAVGLLAISTVAALFAFVGTAGLLGIAATLRHVLNSISGYQLEVKAAPYSR